jgi:CRISPR-associated protein Csd1
VDRYFSALSTRPLAVFGALMRLTEFQLSQLRRRGEAIFFQSKLGDILQRISPSALPTQLSLEEQANFALGFYHQRQQRFRKGSDNAAATEPQNEERN